MHAEYFYELIHQQKHMKPQPALFSFELPLQLRWNDCDPLGHVNNAAYITYFEIGRSLFMLKLSERWDWNKDMFLIANVNCNFLQELKLDVKQPKVHCRVSKMGGKSFDIEYLVSSGSGDSTKLHAVGTTTQVMFDMKTRSTVEIPEWLKNDILNFEKEGSIVFPAKA